MSRIHVHLVRDKTNEGDGLAYLVLSSDYHPEREEEAIGRLELEPRTGSYSFRQLGRLANAKVIPPHVWELSQAQQDELLSRDFADHEYGAMTSRLAKMVRKLLSEGRFPDEMYGTT